MLADSNGSGCGRKHDRAIEFFHQGINYRVYDVLGVQLEEDRRIFRVWAPHADQVFVCGDFNQWSKQDPMKRASVEGVWETCIDVSRICEGSLYKFLIVNGDRELYKADPFALFSQKAPETASVVYDVKRIDDYEWHDSGWLSYRAESFEKNPEERPINIYELHAPSWVRGASGGAVPLCELAEQLVPYVKQMGYTHVELMPVTEHPYEGSWGYQVGGYYAVCSRLGTPEELCAFVDLMHSAGVGVILDWVGAHFPKDAHGLFEFDGEPLYEYKEADRMEHRGWGTRYFDLGCPEVQSFLVSNVMFWLEKFHIDGIRVDAVTSMLYRDYDKSDGEWTPNVNGGNINLEGVDFLKRLNGVVKALFPDVMTFAEESSSYQGVTGFENDGLGFTFKWNMGWMHDTLKYCSTPPEGRKNEHGRITFSLTYAFDENYLLPVSHDEVVHGKRSLIEKMSGEYWQKFATDRAFHALMMTHPGKKLTFMGNEIAQFKEWDHNSSVEWFLLDFEMHAKFQLFCAKLNHFYLSRTELWENDDSWDGFEWIDADNKEQSVFSFIRRDKEGNELVVIANFTETTYDVYTVGVKTYGEYTEVFNTDAEVFGGKGTLNGVIYSNGRVGWNGLPYSIDIKLPALAVAVFSAEPKDQPQDQLEQAAIREIREKRIPQSGGGFH